MKKQVFTNRFIERLKPMEKRFDVMEANKIGFGIRVSPKGTKTWIYTFKFDGKSQRESLGMYPEISLSQAHKLHADSIDLKKRGINPANKRVVDNQTERKANTISELIEDYLTSIKGELKSEYEIRRTFEKEIIPIWGKRKAKSIETYEVISLVDAIARRGAPIQANRTRARIGRLFNWAIGKKKLGYNPCVGMEKAKKEVSRDRVLSVDEIKMFWNGLEKCDFTKTVELVLKLQLVTCQRKGEIVAAERSEIDLEEKIWTMPAHKTKNGELHRVPLSDLALDIINEALALRDNSIWLFPSPAFAIKDEHIHASSINHALRDNLKILNIENVRPHDLRRTGGTFLSQLGIARLTLKKVLNHVEKDVTSIYDRYGYDAEKKHALDLWASKLTEIIAGKKQPDNVVKLNS